MEKTFTSKSPLYIGGSKYPLPYFFPAGTTFYYDGSLPEGVTRFRVYVNIEPSPSEIKEDSKGIAPLTASVLTKEDIINLIKGIKLDSQDAIDIIESSNIGENDKRQILKILETENNSK